MSEPTDWKPQPKVQAVSASLAVGILVVVIWEGLTDGAVPAPMAVTVTSAVAALDGYMMPNEPPWKRTKP